MHTCAHWWWRTAENAAGPPTTTHPVQGPLSLVVFSPAAGRYSNGPTWLDRLGGNGAVDPGSGWGLVGPLAADLPR